MNRTIKMKLWLWLVFLILLIACTGKTSSTSKYPLMVVAGRGALFFGHRVVYAVNEYGAQLNLDLPKEDDLGSDPAWSPDGQWIAHTHTNPNWKSVSDEDIYLMNANDFTQNMRVTYNLAAPLASAWSPDGTQIAFYAYDSKSRPNAIYLVNVECLLQGESCTPEPTFLIPGSYPAWSSDGKKIVYRDASSDEIKVVDVHNPGETVTVSQGLTRCDAPQWSPDGKRIAFVCRGTIYSVDPDGGNRVNLVSGAIPYLKWTPDGKKIAFIGTDVIDPNLGQTLDMEGTVLSTAVFIMDANGANITRITPSNEESIGSFTWIPIDRIETAP